MSDYVIDKGDVFQERIGETVVFMKGEVVDSIIVLGGNSIGCRGNRYLDQQVFLRDLNEMLGNDKVYNKDSFWHKDTANYKENLSKFMED